MHLSSDNLYFELLPAIRGIFLQINSVTVNVTTNESLNNIAKTKNAYINWQEKRSELNSIYLDNSLSVSQILGELKVFESQLTAEQKKLPFLFSFRILA